MDLKSALIESVMYCKNNPYTKEELDSIRLFYIQDIHDSLMLSKGKPIPRLNLELIREIDFDWKIK